MLRAGMMAAGEVDVERRVDLDARLAPVADLVGVTLGIGGREPAAGIAGAGDEPGADRASPWSTSPSASIAASRASTLAVAHARDQQVLPDRQADIAVAEILRDLGEAAHLRRR